MICFLFFFNDTAPTEIYTLSLHDALPISLPSGFSTALSKSNSAFVASVIFCGAAEDHADRKSTRLNSSHTVISYAVFCLKKKKNKQYKISRRTVPRLSQFPLHPHSPTGKQ